MITLQKFILNQTFSFAPNKLYLFSLRFMSNLMAVGTKISWPTRKALIMIIYYHNQYLRSINFGPNMNFQMIQVFEKMIKQHPKIGQHVIDTYYPNLKIPTNDIQYYYPKALLFDSKHQQSITLDVLVTTIISETTLKNSPLFEKGKLYIISGANCEVIKRELCQIPLTETGQTCPDYYYAHFDNVLLWDKHFDFKSGKFKINSGHIAIATTPEMYEDMSKNLLFNQYKFYQNHPIVNKKLRELLFSEDLSWVNVIMIFNFS